MIKDSLPESEVDPVFPSDSVHSEPLCQGAQIIDSLARLQGDVEVLDRGVGLFLACEWSSRSRRAGSPVGSEYPSGGTE